MVKTSKSATAKTNVDAKSKTAKHATATSKPTEKRKTTNVFTTSLTERVDMAALNYIIHHPDLLPLLSLKKRARLRQYRSVLDKNGSCTVKYRQADYGKGRVYALEKLSLQKFPRQIRHTLAKDIYYDIDIKNCNPTLLLQICQKKGWTCNKLKDYVENREDKLNDLMHQFHTTKDIAKDLFLRLMNGGSWRKWIEDNSLRCDNQNPPPYIQEFNQEMSLVRDKIWEDAQFKKFVDIAVNKKKDCNEKSTCASLLLNDIEHRIVMKVADVLKSINNKVVVGVYVFDGLMIEKAKLDKVALDNTLRQCEQRLREDESAKIHGMNWNIQLVEKPMNESLELPPEYIHQQYTLQGLGDHGEVYWAHFLFPLIGHDVKVLVQKVPIFFCFDKEKSVWVESDNAGFVSQLIHSNVTNHLEEERSNIRQLLNTVENKTVLKQELTKTEIAIARSTDSNFLARVALQLGVVGCTISNPAMAFNRKHPELISFENGVVDITTLKLHPRSREHMFTYVVPFSVTQTQLDSARINLPACQKQDRDELPADDPEFFNQLYRFDVFRDRNGITDFLQANIGYSITGFTEQQTLTWISGNGSNGKSVLIDDLLRLFSEPLYHSLNYDAICSTDKNNDEIYNARFSRIASINETDGNTINMKALKALTSGVDTINVSAKFKGVLQFAPMLKLWLLSNHTPKQLLGPDAQLAEKRRIIHLKMRMCYLNQNHFADKAEAEKLQRKDKHKYIAEKDPHMQETLKKRSLGFILWALQGAHRYWNEFNRTLPIPSEISETMRKTLVDKQITPERFFAENFEIASEELEQTQWISAKDLLKEYKECNTGLVQKKITGPEFVRKITKGLKQGTQLLQSRILWEGERQTVYKNISKLQPT